MKHDWASLEIADGYWTHYNTLETSEIHKNSSLELTDCKTHENSLARIHKTLQQTTGTRELFGAQPGLLNQLQLVEAPRG